jgi:hypothetical protein
VLVLLDVILIVLASIVLLTPCDNFRVVPVLHSVDDIEDVKLFFSSTTKRILFFFPN